MPVDDNNASAQSPRGKQEPSVLRPRRRRVVTRRNAVISAIIIAVGSILLILAGLIAYRMGAVDRYVANQIKGTLSTYGIRAEIRESHTSLSPQTVEMLGVELYDARTGEQLGKIDRLLATVRIEDLYALNLRRNINLKDLAIEGLELWVNFDSQGRSNFRNVHNLSGEARNLHATIQPDDPNNPAGSGMNAFALSASNSTFVYDGKPINSIDIDAKGRVNETRAEIQDLTLRSPVTEAHLQGVLDDWRALRYHFNVTSNVDLTQASDILQVGTTLRGAGNFVGTISGEGERYQAEGSIKSDALAADGVRLQGLNVNAKGS